MSDPDVTPFSSGETTRSEKLVDKEASLSKDYELEARIGRLVQALLQGRVVPFLGAGISAWAPARPEHKHDAPTLKAAEIALKLAEKLDRAVAGNPNELPIQHLVQRVRNTAGRDPDGQPMLDWKGLNVHPLGKQLQQALDTSSAPSGGPSPADETDVRVRRGAPEVWPIVPSLGEVAEFCWSILGPKETCETIRFREWYKIYPTAAHHYLSLLIREGLIYEVLETNYDEFVEEAVWETFGTERKYGSSRDDMPDRSWPAPVIDEIATYRKFIARARQPSTNEALVKVVKLNGCAAAYRRGVDEGRAEAAKKIILTEEQLQSWGEKAWAQDLLRDRVRSRALLFIGFGSQDPIVRHHAVAVVREFTASSQPDEDWYKQENAPFVMAFEDNLSFYQFQILRAFREAHTSSPSLLDRVATVYMNAFLGHDGPKLDKGQKRRELPADLFLRRVVGLAICKHASERYFSEKSALDSYLRGALRQPENLLRDTRRRLFAGDVPSPSCFERWLWLEKETQTEQSSSAWATVCFSIRGEHEGRAGYRPFLDAPVKQPMLLALMSLLAPEDGSFFPDAMALRERCCYGENSNDVRPVAGFRLLDVGTDHRRCALYATSYLDAFMCYVDPRNPRKRVGEKYPERTVPNNAVVLLLGRGMRGAFRLQHWVPVDGCEEVMAVREVVAIGDLAALRGQSLGPVSLAEAKENLNSLLYAPESFLGTEEKWEHFCVKEEG